MLLQLINGLCTIVAIALTLLTVLGLILPRSRARQVINRLGEGVLALPRLLNRSQRRIAK